MPVLQPPLQWQNLEEKTVADGAAATAPSLHPTFSHLIGWHVGKPGWTGSGAPLLLLHSLAVLFLVLVLLAWLLRGRLRRWLRRLCVSHAKRCTCNTVGIRYGIRSIMRWLWRLPGLGLSAESRTGGKEPRSPAPPSPASLTGAGAREVRQRAGQVLKVVTQVIVAPPEPPPLPRLRTLPHSQAARGTKQPSYSPSPPSPSSVATWFDHGSVHHGTCLAVNPLRPVQLSSLPTDLPRLCKHTRVLIANATPSNAPPLDEPPAEELTLLLDYAQPAPNNHSHSSAANRLEALLLSAAEAVAGQTGKVGEWGAALQRLREEGVAEQLVGSKMGGGGEGPGGEIGPRLGELLQEWEAAGMAARPGGGAMVRADWLRGAVVGILRAVSQAALAPAAIQLKQRLQGALGMQYKDVRGGGWRIDITFLPCSPRTASEASSRSSSSTAWPPLPVVVVEHFKGEQAIGGGGGVGGGEGVQESLLRALWALGRAGPEGGGVRGFEWSLRIELHPSAQPPGGGVEVYRVGGTRVVVRRLAFEGRCGVSQRRAVLDALLSMDLNGMSVE